MIIPLFVVAWIVVLVVVIKGAVTARILTCVFATAMTIALMFFAIDMGKKVAKQREYSEVVRPMQLLLSDLNSTAKSGQNDLLLRKLGLAEKILLDYGAGRTSLETGFNAIRELE